MGGRTIKEQKANARQAMENAPLEDLMTHFRDAGGSAFRDLPAAERKIFKEAAKASLIARCKTDPESAIPLLLEDIAAGNNINLGFEVANTLSRGKDPQSHRETPLYKQLQSALFDHCLEQGHPAGKKTDKLTHFLKTVYSGDDGLEKISHALSCCKDPTIVNLTVRFAFDQQVKQAGNPSGPLQKLEYPLDICVSHEIIGPSILRHLTDSTQGSLPITLKQLPDDVLIKAIFHGEGYAVSQKLSKILTEIYGRGDKTYGRLLRELEKGSSEFHETTHKEAKRIFDEQISLRERLDAA